jgi:hypothetical protein
MSNFWDNDPIIGNGGAPSAPWANDPLVGGDVGPRVDPTMAGQIGGTLPLPPPPLPAGQLSTPMPAMDQMANDPLVQRPMGPLVDPGYESRSGTQRLPSLADAEPRREHPARLELRPQRVQREPDPAASLARHDLPRRRDAVRPGGRR